MGEGNFTGCGIDIATEQTGVARGVMRCTEGPLRDQSLAGLFDRSLSLTELNRATKPVEI